MAKQVHILGAGMTGLAAGYASGLPVFESVDTPGGICSSYYIRPGSNEKLSDVPADGEAYRFEIGGGHWIFGGDPAVLHFIRSLTQVKSYQRRSAIFFSKQNLFIPYPLQNHLGQLGQEFAIKVISEIVTMPNGTPKTMAQWLEQNFGPTLTDCFFGPFHEMYTAGLWTHIAPQDAYKSPVHLSLVLQGAFSHTPPVGYNASFVYPEKGLNELAHRMAEKCDVRYGKRVVAIDVDRKMVQFSVGADERYDPLISTLPLNKMMAMTGLEVDDEPDPYTSVLVLNIGAVRGARCPDDYWLYIPDSQSGFHRVGFYSNVDVSFLSKSYRETNKRVSIYVERAYPANHKSSSQEKNDYTNAVIKELQAWEFIGDVEVVDTTLIDVAYTWSWPGSQWRTRALNRLEEHDIVQVGRYGRWIFQGIADSIRDGFVVGSALKAA